MAVLTSHVVRDEVHEQRRKRLEELVATLRERTAAVARDGGEKAVASRFRDVPLSAGGHSVIYVIAELPRLRASTSSRCGAVGL